VTCPGSWEPKHKVIVIGIVAAFVLTLAITIICVTSDNHEHKFEMVSEEVGVVSKDHGGTKTMTIVTLRSEKTSMFMCKQCGKMRKVRVPSHSDIFTYLDTDGSLVSHSITTN
jgi:hypothetical protein